jgi:ABC-type polar amino acid transport system ATPase subunit
VTEAVTAIQAQGLQKFYGDFQALTNINLTVATGELVLICRPSGSAKSTLLRCFNGLETHNDGNDIRARIRRADKSVPDQ